MEVTSILLNKILSAGMKKGASSIHISIGSPPMLRVNDSLVPLESEPVVGLDTMNSLMNSIVEEDEVARLEEEKELILVKNFANNFRFRINIFYQKKLPAVSFYFIPSEAQSFEDLKLPDVMGDLTERKSGLFMIVGPYGSGKTTTSTAFLEHINKTKSKFIVTLEDPIEYLFVSKKSIVNQRQVGRDVNSIIDGLDYCLSEEVDIVYVSKIKEKIHEAISVILEIAAGNSLVIMEMNADNAITAVEKIINAAGADISEEAVRYTLSDILIGVLSQRLYPKVGGGLVPAFEVLVMNQAAKSLVREGKLFQLDSVIQTSRQEGMISMDKSVEQLINSGVVKREQI